ncbi:hypothetical protein Zmor_015577 [Zophobas morio]|uniref:Tc1-like transposase DDE domain-containing protein n=1 Tax=Zophobas morio TaxID=2755281 RepID=A0AA38IN21_9CUCU|nr:hypothetical protein Zmor_015577 [Zophobas morio]
MHLKFEPISRQQSASIHVSNSSKTWLRRENIALLPWPAKNPYLNPIENVCGSLVRDIYKHGKQYATINELKDGILKTWENLDVNYITVVSIHPPNFE